MMSLQRQDQRVALANSGFLQDRDAGRATPLRSWTLKQKTWLAQRIHDVHESWCRRWGIRAPALGEVTVCDAHEADAIALLWTPLHACAQVAWGMAKIDEADETPDIERTLAIALFADDDQNWSAGNTRGALAGDVAAKAFDAWLKEMARCIEIVADGPEHATTAATTTTTAISTAITAHALDGMLCVRLPSAQTAWLLRIGGERVHQLLTGMDMGVGVDASLAQPKQHARSATTPVLLALSAHTVPLSVHLATATLTLGELHALQPGDVVTLNHKLSEPLGVHTPDGSLLGRAWLGQADGHVAMRLAQGTESTS